MKHLTVEAEQWCLEQIIKANAEIEAYECQGVVPPSEVILVSTIIAVRTSYMMLLEKFCGWKADDLKALRNRQHEQN